jgi:hypothetical protein
MPAQYRHRDHRWPDRRLAGDRDGVSQVQGFIAAVVVAVFGSIIVRLILNATSKR